MHRVTHGAAITGSSAFAEDDKDVSADEVIE
jgi:hypothetical protein